eukprot:6207179-Pleurochrysis_carterae.AAC.1
MCTTKKDTPQAATQSAPRQTVACTVRSRIYLSFAHFPRTPRDGGRMKKCAPIPVMLDIVRALRKCA